MSRPPLSGGPAARYLLLGSTLALVLGGLVIIYSASSVSDHVRLADSAYHLKRQAALVGVGVVFLLLLQRVDYRVWKRWAWPAWGLTLAGLVAVLVVGMSEGGARRWIAVGPVPVQPSEYAKLACVLVVSLLVMEWQRGRLGDKELFGRSALAVAPVLALVMMQPDMGTAVSIGAAVLFVLWLGDVRARYLVSAVAGGAALAVVGVFAEPYRAARFTSFLDPWTDPKGDGYQIIQALLAFGSGGLGGVGLGLSRQKFFYLPAAHTDFVFAIVGEEAGLLGTLSIVAAFVVFTYAGMRIAMGAKDGFGKLLAGGLTAMIAAQAVLNMAAVTGLTPVTGIPLPLVSYGGSSMTFTLACVGVILSVSRHGSRVRRVRAPRPQEESTRARADERRRHRGSHLSSVDGGRGAVRRRA